jgi:hypothetical protein
VLKYLSKLVFWSEDCRRWYALTPMTHAARVYWERFMESNPADIAKWEISLNSPPAGQIKIGVNLLSTIN